jgi:2-keto-4-pentenoate hydratase
MNSPATGELAADPRVRAGMQAQLELRSARLAAGERPLGWKLGFGSPQALAKLQIAAPLIGFLTDRSVIDSATPVPVAGWTKPLLEPEVAVRVGRADGGEVALAAVGPAIELADLDSEPNDVEAILAGNVFHRAVALGASRTLDTAPIEGLRGEVTRGGADAERIHDVRSATGDPVNLVRHVAGLLAAFGLRLEPGEIVICGSIVPPLEVEPGAHVDFRLEPVGDLALDIAR